MFERHLEYKNDACIDKARVWTDSELFQVYQVNENCQKHGWAKERPCFIDIFDWKCYINGKQMEDSDCKGFKKW